MSTTSEKAIDPICRMSVDPASAAATVDHNGTTYYFCAQECADTFVANGYHGAHEA